MGFFGDTTPGNDRALALTKQEDSASGVGIELLYGDNTGSVQGQVVPWNTPQVSALGQVGITRRKPSGLMRITFRRKRT